MTDTAMRTANGALVFVKDDGSYTSKFPEEHIVRNGSENKETNFVVYGFVGSNKDYEEQSWVFENEEEAVEKATEIYGSDSVEKFTKSGEVFEVEVHERDK